MQWDDNPPECPNHFMLHGDGPFQASELAAFLSGYGFIVSANDTPYKDGCAVEEEVESNPENVFTWKFYFSKPICVVGRDAASSTRFLSLLDDRLCSDKNSIDLLGYGLERVKLAGGIPVFRRSTRLREVQITSQEILLAQLLLIPAPADLLAYYNVLTNAHPVLSQFDELRLAVNGEGFKWPSTKVEERSHNDGSISESNSLDLPDVGILKHLGYAVGRNGGTPAMRRADLSKAFEMSDLPQVSSHEYMSGWGKSGTAKRLEKIANSIASFCRSAKRRRNSDNSDAITDWESDLQWLKATYYDGKFNRQFQWPVGHVTQPPRDQPSPGVSAPSPAQVAQSPTADHEPARILRLCPPIQVRHLADAMGLKSFKVISDLIGFKQFANADKTIDFEIAKQICAKHGFQLHEGSIDASID
jgi:hypothetical protein